ncbi:MAG: hypothetical protein R3A10_02795 [Caldilineaceae bacterium]
MIADLPCLSDHADDRHLFVHRYQDKRWQLDAEPWPRFELAQLTPDQIDRFIAAWYGCWRPCRW